jgi:hypothetical protein
MFFDIFARFGIPPGTPTFPCQGAVRSGGMISLAAGPAEKMSDKKTADVAPNNLRGVVKKIMSSIGVR